MKDYTVYFIIKKDRHGYLNQETVKAHNKKEAVKMAREMVRANTGRNAFNATCNSPLVTRTGCLFNGMLYQKYDPTFHTLW